MIAQSDLIRFAGADTLYWFSKHGAVFTLCCGPEHNCTSPGKIPHEEEWQLHPHTLAEAEQHLKHGGNVGQLTDNLAQVDLDVYADVFLERFGFEQAPYIAREDQTRAKILIRLTEIPTDAHGQKWKLHQRSKHPCIELLYRQNAVVAGVHVSGQTIRLENPNGEIPVMTWAQAMEMCDTWLAILRGDLLHMAEVQEIPTPAKKYKPEHDPVECLNQAAKAVSMPIKTIGDLHDAVLRAWTPLKVFERFGLATNDTRTEKDGWVRVFGNGGLFVNGEGTDQFWCLTGAAGDTKVPGGGAVQAWTWCKSDKTNFIVRGEEFINILIEMAQAAGLVLPAELIKIRNKLPKASKNGHQKFDFRDLVDFSDEEGQTAPGNWSALDGTLKPIEWDWPLWLAKGVLTMLSAESGIGKSLLVLRIAGCYLNGWPWPDGTPFTGERGSILWCEAEAAQALNLERAKAWGLPLNKILTPIAPEGDFRLTNRVHVEALAAEAAKPEVKLIIIDSISAAYPAIEKSTEDAMPVMSWLARLSRDNQKPNILTHHLRKRGIFDGDVVTLDRLRGASAIVQPARLVWAMDNPDPNEKNCKRLSVIKSNLAKYPTPVGLTIGDRGIQFGVAPEAPKKESAVNRAIDLLKALLEDCPRSAKEIEDEFKGAGISESTMNRAKAKLGVISVRNKDGWSWGLPERREYVN